MLKNKKVEKEMTYAPYTGQRTQPAKANKVHGHISKQQKEHLMYKIKSFFPILAGNWKIIYKKCLHDWWFTFTALVLIKRWLTSEGHS